VPSRSVVEDKTGTRRAIFGEELSCRPAEDERDCVSVLREHVKSPTILLHLFDDATNGGSKKGDDDVIAHVR